MSRRVVSFNVNNAEQKGLGPSWHEVEAEPDLIHTGLRHHATGVAPLI